MNKELFKKWLKKEGLGDSAVRDYLNRCERVEKQLGNLDDAYRQDALAGILSQLVADNVAFPMKGDRDHGMDSLRTAVRRYKRFCECCPPSSLPELDRADSLAPMLASITIRNFKSYKEATLPLAPLTLLIGANASGKSNAVEALRLLHWGFSHSTFDLWHKDVAGIRGKKESWFYNREINISFSYTMNSYQYELPFFDLNTLSKIGKKLDPIFCITGSHNLDIPVDIDGNILAEFTRIINAKRRHFIPIQFLDTIPARTRDYADIENDRLQEDAANLSAVLYRLCKDDQHKKCLLDFVKSLPEQDIVDIDFVETPRKEVMVRLVESFGGRERPVDADSLSDGTLRVLALAAFLLAAPAGSLLVVEELDNGIHPSRAKDLVSQMLTLARQRQVQILLTSHNPALLDALPYDALPDVVCCYRDRTEGDSRLVRLGDLPKYPAIMAQGTLGELVTRQVLDRYLHDTTTADEEKAAALDWLEQLRTATEQAHE